MFQNWRFQLRQAEEAMKDGRLDESFQLIAEGGLLEYLPGKRLAARLAHKLAERSCGVADSGGWDAGWRDLKNAGTLGGETQELLAARQNLVNRAMEQAEELLRHGDAAGALEWIGKLERRKVALAALHTLREVARRVDSARHLCLRGRFADAEAQLSAALSLRSDLVELQQQRDDCRAKLERTRELSDGLHRALGASDWHDAATLADELLAVSPESRLAKDARRRAWDQVGADVGESRHLHVTQAWARPESGMGGDDKGEPGPAASGVRFLLWVDGVGGYLVCLGDEVVLGQAATGNLVDVALLADISRRHAKIRREGESYVLEPLHATRIAGRAVQSKTMLHDGDEIELGNGVRLRFRQPHALSGSARLEFLSRHRTQPYADGILLMAESCVLGPRWQNHIVCRDWTGDVVLYRQDDGLYCRAMEAIEIDGQFCDGRGRLEGNSHVVGDDFSMSLEELDRCSTQPLL